MNRKGSTSPRRVLVIYKKSTYELYKRERKLQRLERLLAERNPAVARLMDAHHDHVSTIERTRVLLQKMGARAVFRYRRAVRVVSQCDLVLTLGGDGTLLWTSHMVGPDTPMVAINTAPKDSVGFFCAGTKKNLEETLEAALNDRLGATRLTRMQVDLDGETVSTRVLNDILFCHGCPAATSRYLLRHQGTTEEQKSSGIWVGPAAGSTAGQRSAGGRVLPIRSQALQYVVREGYHPTGKAYELEKGLVEPNDALTIRSKMRGAQLFIDGPHERYDVEIGGELRLTRSPEPLVLLGLQRAKRS